MTNKILDVLLAGLEWLIWQLNRLYGWLTRKRWGIGYPMPERDLEQEW